MTTRQPPGEPGSPERIEHVRQMIRGLVQHMAQHADLPKAERDVHFRAACEFYFERPLPDMTDENDKFLHQVIVKVLEHMEQYADSPEAEQRAQRRAACEFYGSRPEDLAS